MEELPIKRTNHKRQFEVTQSKEALNIGMPNALESVDSTEYKAVSISNFTIEEIVS